VEDYGNFLQEGELSNIAIAELPDAVKYVRIDNPKARLLADYALHKSDLEFVIEVLKEINLTSSSTAKEALWQIAIVKFIKCFVGSSARIALDAKVVFAGKDGALEVFRYFKSLRDKHFVHDENSYTQVAVAAALNDGGKAFKVEKIVALAAHGVTLDQDNYANLSLATNDSLKWVREKFDLLANSITTALEKLSFDELNCLPEISVGVPDIKDIDKRRSSISSKSLQT